MGFRDSELFQLVRGIFRQARPTGHGPQEHAVNGWTLDRPYRTVYSNGIFEGWDGSAWVFFKFPRDVKVHWTTDPQQIVDNQHFLLDVIDEVGGMLDNQVEKSYNDIRRNFAILSTQEPWQGIRPFPGATEAQKDYLSRVSVQLEKPEWSGYMGFQLAEGNILNDAYGIPAKVERWIEYKKDPSSMQFEFYQQDYEDLYNIMVLGAGFLPIDFSAERNEDGTTGLSDYQKLTAWYDEDQPRYGYKRETESAPFSEFVHGHSLLVNRHWGEYNEIKFYAIRPKDDFFMADPQSSVTQWGGTLYRPDLNIVHVRIAGQIRSRKTGERIFDSKYSKADRRKRDGGSYGEKREQAQRRSKLDAAYYVARSQAMLDNVEITVAQLVTEKESTLPSVLGKHYLEPAPLVNRQPEALLSTLPTYPNQVFRVRKFNDTRNALTNQMFGGVLAFSGLFRKTRPADTEQLFLGLSDGGSEYVEIYTDIAAAKRHNNVPGFCVTGRPGSGKTQFMLQMVAQIRYMEYAGVYLNPKREGSLKKFFDFLGGLSVILTPEYMSRNPGILDPVFYHDAIAAKAGDTFETGRQKVADTLANSIVMSSKILHTKEEVRHNEDLQTELKREIKERAMDPRNRCSGDIIFGNPEAGTEPITNEDFRRKVENNIYTSPLWKGMIGRSPNNSGLAEQMIESKCILIEWGSSLNLPSSGVDPATYDANQIDSIISINVAFEYATEIASLNRAGGAIFADEAWVFKHSPQTREKLNRGSREWREGNMMFFLGSQEIKDFAGDGNDSMMSYFSRLLFLAISELDNQELKLYFDRTGLKPTEGNRRYIVEAGTDKKSARAGMGPPRGYYMDTINKWYGGIICGPYPERELEMGRTDKIEETLAQEKDSMSALYGGIISGLVNETVHEERDRLDQDFERVSSSGMDDAESTFTEEQRSSKAPEEREERRPEDSFSQGQSTENVDISLHEEG